ncbi:hypothetical protein [Asticcacaulis benevestitus]|uniref:Uncharacterized protein n=1 Tax=Asticcacaulis benevestitus DSM 16100 = ATCC BAA-896 TaxID=1121022 RepID=V4PKU6_9CAUL|nr:hypothetical protein [Asticcacaulis benevestitus]ESQ87889.1 hypothetical protein ABENE_16745 [Asticcacaulis benevestitus DSM 16100 = ATCC BAA-896]
MNARAASHSKTNNQSAREVRNLVNLGETASTSRVLNLSQIFTVSGRTDGYRAQPFFKHSQLNKALVIKHTLRAGERGLFAGPRRTATKLILPFDPADLRLGGRSIFVNQSGYLSFVKSFFNSPDMATNTDLQLLQHIDNIPSLDPFLVREHLARFGFRPDPCYLKISPHDLKEMVGFANEEIERLVMTAFGAGMEAAAMRLTSKILANNLDSDLEPLKQTFRMSDEDFNEGMFSWRGFLYFKWRQVQLQEEIRQVVEGLKSYRTIGPADAGTREYLEEARPRLAKKIMMAIVATRKTLRIYDDAYQALTQGSDPVPFRKFLLNGPSMFFDLGECIGILSHIGSFWTYRMGAKMAHARVTPAEFADILVDFEESLLSVEVATPQNNAGATLL